MNLLRYLSFAISAAPVLAMPISALATGGVHCKSDSGFSISLTTGRMPGNPIVADIRVKLAGNSYSIPRTCVIGYWSINPRLWLALQPNPDCGVTEAMPMVQLKVKESSQSFRGKVFINHMGTTATQDVSCELG